MKSMTYKVIFLLAAISTLLLFEGCTQKNLNDDTPTTIAKIVQVSFDWRKAPDSQVSSMNLYLYADSHDVMNYWFNNKEGGTITSYGGRHVALFHSNDDPYVHLIRNQETHGDFEIFTDNTSMLVGQGISTRTLPRAPGTEDEPLRTAPSMIYGAHDHTVDLKASYLEQKVTFYPEELVCHYSVEFVNVENLQSADVRIDATISSLAGGYYLGRMTTTSEAVSHPFTLKADLREQSLRSDFLTFGVPSGEKRPHMLSVYIALRNRTGSFYTFDVSDQVNDAPDPRNVNIKIYGLSLPEIPDDPPPPTGEGGLTVEIDTWDTVYVDLPV